MKLSLMSRYTPAEIELFYEHQRNCDVDELITWIIQLLPQQEFDDYMTHVIEEDNLDKAAESEQKDWKELDDVQRHRDYLADQRGSK